jgi:hypothetical protein
MSSSFPPTLDFAAAEEEICAEWTKEETFKNQDKLSLERGDEVSKGCCALLQNSAQVLKGLV